MPMMPFFYNGTIRKYIIMFGRMFNDIDVVRYTKEGTPEQSIRVPIAYGPKEKWLLRLEDDPSLDKQVAIKLPRLSFEMTDMIYDPTRALNKMQKFCTPSSSTNTVKSQYSPTPYNFNITLYGMFEFQEDAVQVTEQILPFFRPEWTMSLKLLDDFPDYYDVPTILNGMNIEDTYDMDFLSRRAIIYSWNFTIKGYLFGPTRNSGIIKRSVIDISNNSTGDPIGTEVGPNKKIILTPGLLANGSPTSNSAASIPWENITANSDYGYAFDSYDYFDGKNRHEH